LPLEDESNCMGIWYELKNLCPWHGSNPKALALETDALSLCHRLCLMTTKINKSLKTNSVTYVLLLSTHLASSSALLLLENCWSSHLNVFFCSCAGVPAITVPASLSPRGLPVGLQFIGQPFQEQRLLEVAHWFEQNTDFLPLNLDFLDFWYNVCKWRLCAKMFTFWIASACSGHLQCKQFNVLKCWQLLRRTFWFCVENQFVYGILIVLHHFSLIFWAGFAVFL
jgi:hypothetical protein